MNALADAIADTITEQPYDDDTAQPEHGQPIGQFEPPSLAPGYGQAYSPSDDEPVTRLNLTAEKMGEFLSQQQASVNAARRSLDLATAQAVNLGYDLDAAEAWSKLRTEQPDVYDSLDRAIRYARKIANAVNMNAEAGVRETGAAPITLDERDAERASVLLPLIRTEIEAGTMTELRDRFRHAIVTENRPLLYLFATLVPARLNQGAGRNPDGTARRADGDKRIRAEIADMLADARAKLRDRSLTELHKQALNTRSAAIALKHAAGKRHRATTVQPFDRLYAQQTGREIIRAPWRTGTQGRGDA